LHFFDTLIFLEFPEIGNFKDSRDHNKVHSPKLIQGVDHSLISPYKLSRLPSSSLKKAELTGSSHLASPGFLGKVSSSATSASTRPIEM
jgi:hypothetical protein